ncbi:MAG: glycosyltransferase [Paludibacteraceae bacterium]|nr:glycosyltransferase [Paludibacteraceae bacterium]
MKQNILFVIHTYNTGGVVSSLRSILHSGLSLRYEFRVFSITRGYDHRKEFLKWDCGCNFLTESYFSDFADFPIGRKMEALPIKILKSVPCIREKLKQAIIKFTIWRIEKKVDPCLIIAFQEGMTTDFCSIFRSPNKIAWIHSDYNGVMPVSVDKLQLYSEYRKIVCVSEFTRSNFISRYPSLKDRVCAIHNVFDQQDIVQKSKQKIDDIRFKTDLYTIITVGRISYIKQLSQLPAVASKLKNMGAQFRWYIIGGGNEGGEKERLDQELAKYDLDDMFVLLGNKPNPYPYFREADLLVTNSSSEACPMIFNEAKILGLSVVSNNFGSAYEFLSSDEGDIITTTDNMAGVIYLLITKEKQKKAFRDVSSDSIEKISALIDEFCRPL